MSSVPDPAPVPTGGTRLAGAFVFALGVLLASAPARNPDVWAHLAGGRAVVAGDFAAAGRTWLYDLISFALYTVGGGAALAGAKALAVGLAGLFAFGVARARAGAPLAALCVALALLSAGARAPLQPVVVSYALFALALRLAVGPGVRPWTLVAVFAVWANCDQWAPVGLVAVALVWVGRGEVAARWRWLAACACACALSPAHARGLLPEVELASPFAPAQLAALADSPAARAYFALLALFVLAALAGRKRLPWELALPALALAGLSAASARLVPFFALVGGPALAWCAAPALERARTSAARVRAARAATGAACAALLVAAWAGWVQGAPYGARAWAVEPSTGRASAAREVERLRAAGALAPGTRLLHPSEAAARAFRWFAPNEDGTADAAALAALARPDADPRAVLRALRVSGAVVVAGESPRATDLLDRLLVAPHEWPLLHATGGVAVFGWRDPDGPPGALADHELDLGRLAFHPSAAERLAGDAPPAPRAWWHALWTPIPPRPAHRDEALLLLLKAEADRLTAQERHARAWAGGQFGGLLAAAPGAHPAALVPRFGLLVPPRGPNGEASEFARVAVAYQAGQAAAAGDAPPEPLYAAVRAARRAVAADPEDASAHLVLGRCYLRLADASPERAWGERFPLLAQLRLAQAAGALNRAVELNPRLAAARLEVGALYRRMNCGDLAVLHLRAYRELVGRAGGRPDPRASDDVMARLDDLLTKHAREFAAEGARASLGDRALMAARRGLAGEALNILLGSDVSAFGTPGMSLELDLLLKTGRGRDLLSWATPELRGPLGPEAYSWLRAQAHLALGDYTAADLELDAVPASAIGAPESAARFARLTGKAVLEARPGSVAVFDACWRVLAESDYGVETGAAERDLAHRCDLYAVRGLMALEAGDTARAESLFAEALRFGRLDFGARPVAVTGRAWLAQWRAQPVR